jgi:phosphonate degradation associated HDIG domain protein
MAFEIDEIIRLYETRGAAMYGGEAVSQLEHALQCAALAAEAGASDALVAACLLHDFGHLVAPPARRGGDEFDDVHQYLAIPFLRRTLPNGVLEPIRLHVDAKRYLCYAEGAYWESLSLASKRSLELQGGKMNVVTAERFLSHPYCWDAVRLRRWDDLAKAPGKATPPLSEFAPILDRAAREAVPTPC